MSERREHIDEQPRAMDWQAELKALLRDKGYDLSDPLEFLGGRRRNPADESTGRPATSESLEEPGLDLPRALGSRTAS